MLLMRRLFLMLLMWRLFLMLLMRRLFLLIRHFLQRFLMLLHDFCSAIPRRPESPVTGAKKCLENLMQSAI
jgi:hypothetical protein